MIAKKLNNNIQKQSIISPNVNFKDIVGEYTENVSLNTAIDTLEAQIITTQVEGNLESRMEGNNIILDTKDAIKVSALSSLDNNQAISVSNQLQVLDDLYVRDNVYVGNANDENVATTMTTDAIGNFSITADGTITFNGESISALKSNQDMIIQELRKFRPFKYLGTYNRETTYNTNNLVEVTTGKQSIIYLALRDGIVGITPANDAINWVDFGDISGIDLNDYYTKLEIDNVVNGINAKVNDNSALIETKLNINGNQTVNGIKTFSESPIVPDAVNDNQAVNKKQLDSLPSTLKFDKLLFDYGDLNVTASAASNYNGYRLNTDNPNFRTQFDNPHVYFKFVFELTGGALTTDVMNVEMNLNLLGNNRISSTSIMKASGFRTASLNSNEMSYIIIALANTGEFVFNQKIASSPDVAPAINRDNIRLINVYVYERGI